MENQTSTTETAIATIDAASIAQETLLAAIERSTDLKKLKPAVTLTAQYLELEKPGESFRGVYIGTQPMTVADKGTGEMKTLEAARFIIEKSVWINAGTVLVNEIKRANIPVGTPLEVTYLSKEGNTKLYSVTLLA